MLAEMLAILIMLLLNRILENMTYISDIFSDALKKVVVAKHKCKYPRRI